MTTQKYYSPSWMVLLSACATLLLAGCSTPMNIANMVPTDIRIDQKHSQSVRIKATGGGWLDDASVQLSSESLATLLEQVIQNTGAFGSTVKTGEADYLLEVCLENIGYSDSSCTTAHSIMGWRLTECRTRRVLYREMLLSEGSCDGRMDALIVPAEASVRSGIKKGLERAVASIHQ